MSSSREEMLIIGVGGGTASGKTTFVRQLASKATQDLCSVIELDWYYRDFPKLTKEERDELNFDHPDSLEANLLVQHLKELKEGKTIKAPQYDFSTHKRSDRYIEIIPKPLIVVEGILALHYPELRKIYTRGYFVDHSDEDRLIRRMERDIRERGRTEESVRKQWEKTVHPMHRQFCYPSSNFAVKKVSGVGVDIETIDEILGLIR